MAELEEKQSRREFLKNLPIIGAFTVAVLSFLWSLLLYLFPPIRKKRYHKYLVAKFEEIPVGEAKEITLGGKPVFVVHLEDGYRVFSGICTHLGCIVRWEPEKDRFFCPCHKGVYAKDGTVVSGPPPRPLDQFRVETQDDMVFIYIEEKLRSPWA